MTRAGTVRVGDRVRFDGQVWDVGGLDAGTVYLSAQGRRPLAVTLSTLFADPTFDGQSGRRARGALPPTALFNELPAEVQERARWWEEHLTEVIDGVPCSAPAGTLPRPEFDVTTTTLRQREQAKVNELAAERQLPEQGGEANLRLLQRRRAAYEVDGLLGLVDRRAVRSTSVAGRTDPRVVEALQRVLERNRQRSSGTSDRLWRDMVRDLEAEHGVGEVPLPSRATFHRLLKRLTEARHATGSARTRRTLAQQPDGPFGAVFPVRPGELMQVDSTPLDVAVVLADGVVGRVELTALVDIATRSLPAAVLRPTTKAVDAALLLARCMTPESMRPGWPEAVSMAYSALPYQAMRSVDDRLEHAAAQPVIVPETIVFDHGKAYLSDTFRSACRTLGISIQPAHPDTPTDKPVVERTLQSVGTLFAQYVAGYLGSSVERRGKNAEHEAVFSLVELQDLLDEWIVTGWQNRPHEGLRDPLSPGQVLTPNEKYAAMLGVAGYVPVPLSGDDYIELLPMKPRAINSYGVKINHRVYDSEQLNPYRGQPSGAVGMKDLWEVHHDPYDVTRVWVRNHHKPDDGWITLWWRQLASAPVPFGEDAWSHARKVIAERGQSNPSEDEIARLVDDLLQRASGEQSEVPPTGKKRKTTTARDRRVAARTSANNSAPSPLPQASPPDTAEPAGEEPANRDAPDELPDATGVDEEHLAEVIPLGVYDPHQEAQRWW
jgi:putative transposase